MIQCLGVLKVCQEKESLTRRQDSQGRGYYRRYDRSQSYDCNGISQSQNGRTGGFYRECSNSRSSHGQYERNQLGNRGQQVKSPAKEQK